MIERLIAETNNNQFLSGYDKLIPISTDTDEYLELQFHFNTIFNDILRQNSSDQKIFGIDRAFSIKNKYISLNFSKREPREITAYGWYDSNTNDEKKFEDLIYRLKSKGIESNSVKINVSPQVAINDDIHDIIICKFIVGKSLIVFENEDFKKTKETYDNYDTVIYVKENEKAKTYEVLKPENVQLLYLVKIKDSDFEQRTIQCTGQGCTAEQDQTASNAEPGKDLKDQKKGKVMYFCYLIDNYLCKNCHEEYHKNHIHSGNFDVSKCELKEFPNFTGDCENIQSHQKREKEIIEFYCTECNRGICSYCRFYGNQKHSKLEIITKLFAECAPPSEKNSKYDKIQKEFQRKAGDLSKSLNEIQLRYEKDVGILMGQLRKDFEDSFHEVDGLFTKEGEKLVGINHQLNYLRDICLDFHSFYEDKEKILKDTRLRQELYWTKIIHMQHILYLIALKDKINSLYTVNQSIFNDIMKKYREKIKKYLSIFQMMDEYGYKEIVQEKVVDNNFTTDELKNFLATVGASDTKKSSIRKSNRISNK